MKIVFLAPHLSTGGMPQFLLKRIQALLSHYDIYVIEHNFHGDAYVIQRNQIKELLGDRFYSMFENKMDIINVIKDIQPDIIHIDEVSERLDKDLIIELYDNNRSYKIVETPHDVTYNPKDKLFIPDLLLFCSTYHEETYGFLDTMYYTIQYPIDNLAEPENKVKYRLELGLDLRKRHVLNVGLWTAGKNQGEMLKIARQYPNIDFHSIGNQAINFEGYWKPLMDNMPPNVHIYGEKKSEIIRKFMIACDIFMFNSLNECSPLALREAISYGMTIVARNLPTYAHMFDAFLQPIESDLNNVKREYAIPLSLNSSKFEEEHVVAYQKLVEKPINKQKVAISQHFVEQPFLEIKGASKSDYLVKFLDEQGRCHYESIIKSNSWVRLNRRYFTKWTAKVYEDGQLIYKNTLDLTGKKVFIVIDSKSLGDTIAWIPYCLEFKKKHNCDVVVSTFWNHLFDYPELEFVEPGSVVGCYAMYNIGWKWHEDKEPVKCNTIPLQQAATNILGLDYVELRPKMKLQKYHKWGKKYVVIATNSTMECKFWTLSGWQEIINYLWQKGYEVINVSKEDNPFENCTKIKDTSIEYTIQTIQNAEFFIGLSSGLSWLAWALEKEVVMIANFTEEDHEFKCHRVIKKDVCNGCWNDISIKLDPYWLWCPRNKDFECQRTITGDMVINKIKEAGI